jgi:hypothetical protein
VHGCELSVFGERAGLVSAGVFPVPLPPGVVAFSTGLVTAIWDALKCVQHTSPYFSGTQVPVGVHKNKSNRTVYQNNTKNKHSKTKCVLC